jgi:hypothetical protein
MKNNKLIMLMPQTPKGALTIRRTELVEVLSKLKMFRQAQHDIVFLKAPLGVWGNIKYK